ncbi:actin cytoskeleton and mitosis protein [Lodderomyces elongisporus]|uniref:actin cytoskeleton and mitosis protein n=1 Tax=Lodderomyces elongisporus TaxID=36914 RepID=UPI00291D6018|nr:actin cytoskeleton and mitosis protein [Lodderomyces elongisporus]WLF77012.1 actin cytoskeleton and mitosis protein [Lodderomyces elongisporus]
MYSQSERRGGHTKPNKPNKPNSLNPQFNNNDHKIRPNNSNNTTVNGKTFNTRQSSPTKTFSKSKNISKRLGTGKKDDKEGEEEEIKNYDNDNYDDKIESRKKIIKKQKPDQVQIFSSQEIQATGPLFPSPGALGFKSRNQDQTNLQTRARPIPRYFLTQPKYLVTAPFEQNEWDRQNQMRMDQMEASNGGKDYQGLYEEFQKLREVERKEMEKLGLVDGENIAKSLDDAIAFQGSCLDMCPVFERVRRQLENNVKALEKDPYTNKISKEKAVKAFSRPAAGQPPPLPSDVRPPHILRSTLNYLVEEVVDKLPEAHSFLWDRTRSIRQDFTYQNSFGPEAVECNEKIVRIHLLSLHIMAGSDVEYSQQQELEQFNKALQTLMEIYQDVRNNGGSCPNEAEFRAYHLLSHIRDPDLERQVQNLPSRIFNDNRVQLALELKKLASQNNIVERGVKNIVGALDFYVEFFRKVYSDETPLLIACLLETQFSEIRFYALKAMSRSFHSKSKGYSLSRLQEDLGFANQEKLLSFLKYYEIDIIQENNENLVDLFNQEKLKNKYKLNSFHDKPRHPPIYSPQIDNKIRGQSLKQFINEGISNGSFNLKADHFLPQPVLNHKYLGQLIPSTNTTVGTPYDIKVGAQVGNQTGTETFPSTSFTSFSFTSPSNQPFKVPNTMQTIVTETPDFQSQKPLSSTFQPLSSSGHGLKFNNNIQFNNTVSSDAMPTTTQRFPTVPTTTPRFPTASTAPTAPTAPAAPVAPNFKFPTPSTTTNKSNLFSFGENQSRSRVPKSLSINNSTIGSPQTVSGHQKYSSSKPDASSFAKPLPTSSEIALPPAQDTMKEEITREKMVEFGSFTSGSSLTQPPSSLTQTKPQSHLPLAKTTRKILSDSPLYSKAVEATLQKIVTDCIDNELRNLLPNIFQDYNAKTQRVNMIKSLGSQLFDAFMSEIIYNQSQECLADQFCNSLTKKHVLHLLACSAERRMEEYHKKKLKNDELRAVSFRVTKRTLSKNSNIDDEAPTLKRHMKDPMKMNYSVGERKKEIKKLWKPLDLKHFCELCSKNADLKIEDEDLTLKFLLVVEDWSNAYSKWLHSKFSLKADIEKSVYENRISTDSIDMEVTSIPRKELLTKAFFNNCSFIVFEFGLLSTSDITIEQKLARDCKVLRNICMWTDRYSTFKTHIVILFWDASHSNISNEKVSVELKLEQILALENVVDVVLCNMSSADHIGDILNQAVYKIAQNFNGALTTKGYRRVSEIRQLKNVRKTEEANEANEVNKVNKVGDTLPKLEERSIQRMEKKLLKKANYLKKFESQPPLGVSTLNRKVSAKRNMNTGSIASRTYASILAQRANRTGMSASSVNSTFINTSHFAAANNSDLNGFGRGVVEESTPVSSPRKDDYSNINDASENFKSNKPFLLSNQGETESFTEADVSTTSVNERVEKLRALIFNVKNKYQKSSLSQGASK